MNMVGLVIISIIWTISVPEVFADCPHSCQPEDSCQASIGLLEQSKTLFSQNDFTGYFNLQEQLNAMRSGCSNKQVCCRQSDVTSEEEIRFYCRNEPDTFQYCRTCDFHRKGSDHSCENGKEKCRCGQISLNDRPRECNVDNKCLVNEDTLCRDAIKDDVATAILSESIPDTENAYGDISVSQLACQSEANFADIQGNQLIIEGQAIDALDESYGRGDGFQVSSFEECFAQCHGNLKAADSQGVFVKTDQCGAWTFLYNSDDSEEGTCHLYNRRTCCAQSLISSPNPNAVMGFTCPHCWSSHGQCPCSDEVLYTATNRDANIDAHSAGGEKILHNNPTAVITTISTRSRSTLACTWVRNARRQWRCLPTCPKVNRAKRCVENGIIKKMR